MTLLQSSEVNNKRFDMDQRQLFLLITAWAAFFTMTMASSVVVAQNTMAEDAISVWESPRTPWGDPDIEGIWRYEATIPLERPDHLQDRAFLTDEEVASIASVEEKLAMARLNGLDGVDVGKSTLEESPIRYNEYNSFWQDHGRPRQVYAQTSLILDPPDGKLPYTDDAREAARRSTARYGVGPYESYLDPDTGERCLTDGAAIMMWQGPNGGHNRIVQSPGYVTILHEEYQDRRIIPIGGQSHRGVKQWLGDSVGRWEDDVLIVETTNFLDKTNYEWANIWSRTSDTLRLVERFERVDPQTIEYTLTVEDPKTFTRPWTAVIPIFKLPDSTHIFEYACHEGNYALSNMLSAGRAEAVND
jgi:hypothetical protein